MFNAVLGKMAQDPRLRELLLSTKKRVIIEHTTNDSYWGDGGAPKWRTGDSGNKLGQILMEVREVLRKAPAGDHCATFCKRVPAPAPAAAAPAPSSFKHTSHAPMQPAVGARAGGGGVGHQQGNPVHHRQQHHQPHYQGGTTTTMMRHQHSTTGFNTTHGGGGAPAISSGTGSSSLANPDVQRAHGGRHGPRV